MKNKLVIGTIVTVMSLSSLLAFDDTKLSLENQLVVNECIEKTQNKVDFEKCEDIRLLKIKENKIDLLEDKSFFAKKKKTLETVQGDIKDCVLRTKSEKELNKCFMKPEVKKDTVVSKKQPADAYSLSDDMPAKPKSVKSLFETSSEKGAKSTTQKPKTAKKQATPTKSKSVSKKATTNTKSVKKKPVAKTEAEIIEILKKSKNNYLDEK
jgi:hypothetical protein